MRRALLLLALTLAAAAPVAADVVELKTGDKLEGKVKQVTPTEVVIDVAGKETKLEREKVRSIQLDAAPAAKPAPPSVAKDAMAALRSAQSAAGPGAVHGDYAQAVSEAEFAVSRYLRDPADAPAKAAMKDALALHVFALTAWETRLRTFGYAALEIDPAGEKCPALKRVLSREEKAVAEENARQKARFDREVKAKEAEKAPPPPEPAPIAFEPGQVIATKGVAGIWNCAGDRIDAAQKLLDAPPPPPAKK